MKTINVVAAVIIENDRVFTTQRGYGEYKDLWEFPGGKIEKDETPEDALKREILEELDTKIEIKELIDTIEHDYSSFHLSMACYLATVVSGKLILKEHENSKWLTKAELNTVKWLPADLKLLDKVAKYL